MEGYNGSEHGTPDAYLIQGADANPHLVATPPLEQVEVMDNEGATEFIIDQGMYYPAATNYYGYYCTGFEPTGEWDDHQRVFGLDGSDFHYAGLQSENLPYVYYTPSYGYAQSPYNPYNPYIPGAIVGVDGSFVGMQQYYPGSTYQHPSSHAYLPLVVQPNSIPNGGLESHLLSAGTASADGPTGPGSKLKPPSPSVGTVKIPPSPASGVVRTESTVVGTQSHYSGKRPEASKANTTSSKHSLASTSTASHIVSHATTSEVAQVPPLRSPLKVASPVTNGLPDIGGNTRGWSVVDKVRPRLQYGGVLSNGNGNPDFLGEQNRGPRTNRSKSQWMTSFSVEAYTTREGPSSSPGKIIISADDYNKEDFPVNYSDAKFFVIKSYSEDDVHKSIKYNVWSSTPNGNKRLDSAFEDARRIAAGKSRSCPVFLFFSVNASGQFCGVAEMTGAVDFSRDMDFWQQDKWSGSFPVKWHIIKDVPNNNFRRIILENNENKPVTNSRDTQEIQFKQGLEMLNIFKSYLLKTSILDDFMYYEERQKIMQEEKARLLGKSYDASFFLPAFVPSNKSKHLDQHPTTDEKSNNHTHPNNNSEKSVSLSNRHVLRKTDSISTNSSSCANDDTKRDGVGDANNVTTVLKIGSLTIDPKQTETKPSAAPASLGSSLVTDVVTVGSMPVKVNGFSESSSGILTVGTIPIVPKAAPGSDKSVMGNSSGAGT